MMAASTRYNAADIEVLSGLEPVRRRPGMYTDTTRPNHLIQEVVDNSVDEALAGHAKQIDVTVHKDGSVTVIDDGRGMSVVIALSSFLEVLIRREGTEYRMRFKDGEVVGQLETLGDVPKRRTGTTLR